ncbi:Ubiquitin--protein ligase [Bertholletia excelsa]
MAIFSVGREEDSEGPSSPRPKKQRATPTRDEENQRQTNDQLVEELEKEETESESDSEDEDSEDSEADGEEEDVRIERQRTTTVQLCKTGSDVDRGASARISGDASISVTLTDTDVLDCPICLDPLRSPVFQCENGHVACFSCCTKLRNRCPTCSLPIGYNRCRALEKVLESVKVSCQNLKYGCKETLCYSKKHDHEETCAHAPCSCPIPECHFFGAIKELALHCRCGHSTIKFFQYNRPLSVSLQKQEKHLVLLEQNEGIIFILNNGIERLGNVISFTCVGPPRIMLSYDVKARNGGCSVSLQSSIESVQRLVEPFPLKRFLLIPSDFVTSCGQVKLELCVWRLR